MTTTNHTINNVRYVETARMNLEDTAPLTTKHWNECGYVAIIMLRKPRGKAEFICHIDANGGYVRLHRIS